MARALICDACGHTTPETEREKDKWTLATHAKLSMPSSIVQKIDLCPKCTSELRLFYQRRATRSE